jgi:hypothetical protein
MEGISIMASFTITNISQNTVTYEGNSISPGSSFTTPVNSSSYITDLGFIVDLAYGNIKIAINGVNLSGREAVNAIFLLSCFPTPNYQNLTGNGTTTIKSGPGILSSIIINNANTGGTITVYDNTSASGTVIANLQIGTPVGGLLSTTGLVNPIMLSNLNTMFSNGLTVVTSGSNNNNITIYYL